MRIKITNIVGQEFTGELGKVDLASNRFELSMKPGVVPRQVPITGITKAVDMEGNDQMHLIQRKMVKI